MPRPCQLRPCLRRRSPREVLLDGRILTRGELLSLRLRDGSPLGASSPVVVRDSAGVELLSTASVVSELLRSRSLDRSVRSVLPSVQDPSRAPGGHLEGYYERLESQHLDRSSSQGSVFHDLPDLEALLEQAVLSGADLHTSDDRGSIAADLMSAGFSAEDVAGTFREEVRYIRLEGVLGWNGLAVAHRLHEDRHLYGDIYVDVVRTKPGTPQSFVVSSSRGNLPLSPESMATLVVGPDPQDASVSRLYTAHPGLPVPSLTSDPVDAAGVGVADGDRMALADFMERFPHLRFLKVDAASAAPLPEVHPLGGLLPEASSPDRYDDFIAQRIADAALEDPE